jgi:CBS domain-containing protein
MEVTGNIGVILNEKRREIFSISPNHTVFEAIKMLDEKNIGALLVMDGDKLVGMFSERDYTRKISLHGKRSRETCVSEVMTIDVKLTHPNETVDSCLRLMTDKRVRHLPVMENDKVIGLISIGDLVKHVIASQSAAIAHLENYISGGYSS